MPGARPARSRTRSRCSSRKRSATTRTSGASRSTRRTSTATRSRRRATPSTRRSSLPASPRSCWSGTSSRRTADSAFRNDLRRSVIFGRHDLHKDPPISRVDLLVSPQHAHVLRPGDPGPDPRQLLLRAESRRLSRRREGRGAPEGTPVLRPARPQAADLRQGRGGGLRVPRPAAGAAPAPRATTTPAPTRHSSTGRSRSSSSTTTNCVAGPQPGGAHPLLPQARRTSAGRSRTRGLLPPGRPALARRRGARRGPATGVQRRGVGAARRARGGRSTCTSRRSPQSQSSLQA